MDNIKLLAGLPFEIHNVGELKPITLKQIANIGEKQYQQYLNILCFDIDDLEFEKEVPKDITTYDILISNCVYSVEFKNKVISALSFFFDEEVQFIDKHYIFYLGKFQEERFIYRDNFNEIKEVLAIQNSIHKRKSDYNPANSKAQEIAERLKKAKEKINKLKAKNEEELSLSDLISAFAFYNHSVDITKVWNFTIYQFNDQFKRMQLVEKYDLDVQQILQGADPNKVKIKHFISKLE